MLPEGGVSLASLYMNGGRGDFPLLCFMREGIVLALLFLNGGGVISVWEFTLLLFALFALCLSLFALSLKIALLKIATMSNFDSF